MELFIEYYAWIIKFFVCLKKVSLLCSMRILLLLALFLSVTLASCKSEYEERLQEARELQERYLVVEESNMLSPREELADELRDIQSEIEYLARVSGNEYMFFKDLNGNVE